MMILEPTSTSCFKNPSKSTLCLCVYLSIIAN
jgi:hypothetical protein